MRRRLVLAGLAGALFFSAGVAASAPRPHTKAAHAKKVARTAQVDSRIEIVAGAERVVPFAKGQLDDLGEAIKRNDVFTTDAVDLACPAGLTAIGGGFRAPGEQVVALIGSSPSPGLASAWRLEVEVRWPDADDATWTPYVSCAR